MHKPKDRITREQLYSAVWSKATQQVAKDLGISDVALAKICRKLNVPKPRRGYWRQVETGKPISRPPLSALAPGVTSHVEIHRQMQGSARRPSIGSPPVEVKEDAFKNIIPETLQGCHPAILEAKKWIDRGCRVDSWRLNCFTDKPGVVVRVSKSSADRALRFLEGLIRALRQHGLGLVRNGVSNVLGFGCGDDSLHFTISEHLSRESARETRGPVSLRLEVDPCLFNELHRTWTDCKRYGLEEKVREIVERVSAGVETVRNWRLGLEAVEAKRAEERNREQEKLRVAAEEEAFRTNLLTQADLWQRAKLLRAFIAACENEFQLVNPAITVDVCEAKWLSWAREHADRIDPMKNGFLNAVKKRFS